MLLLCIPNDLAVSQRMLPDFESCSLYSGGVVLVTQRLKFFL